MMCLREERIPGLVISDYYYYSEEEKEEVGGVGSSSMGAWLRKREASRLEQPFEAPLTMIRFGLGV